MSAGQHSGFANSLPRCPDCGKVRFKSKAVAKRRARQMRGREGRLSAYRCGDWWHLGHLPPPVITGKITRDDLTHSPPHGDRVERDRRFDR